MTFVEFVKLHGITATTEWRGQAEHHAQKFSVVLKYHQPAGTIAAEQFDWTAGNAIVTEKYAPIKTLHDEEQLLVAAKLFRVNPADVLQCLALDSSAVDTCFEDWADEFGYDADSREAEKTYRACVENALKLRKWLGGTRFAELRKCTEE